MVYDNPIVFSNILFTASIAFALIIVAYIVRIMKRTYDTLYVAHIFFLLGFIVWGTARVVRFLNYNLSMFDDSITAEIFVAVTLLLFTVGFWYLQNCICQSSGEVTLHDHFSQRHQHHSHFFSGNKHHHKRKGHHRRRKRR